LDFKNGLFETEVGKFIFSGSDDLTFKSNTKENTKKN
jgi:hypothetical protein